MDSTGEDQQLSPNLDGWRAAFFSSAKKLWFGGLIMAYVAILALPISAFCHGTRWAGAIVALLLSTVGMAFRAWSDSIRGDADTLHRANELNRGIGHPIAPSTISDLHHRHSRLARSAEKHQKEHASYYEHDGEPSASLLTAMLRESAWWTSRLAATMRNYIRIAAVVGLIAPAIVLLLDMDQAVRAYGALACAVMLIDLFHLGSRYERLRAGCDLAFKALDQVHRTGTTEREALILATDYQTVRASGPLLPDWLWKRQRKRLQEAWSAALGKHAKP